MTTASHRAPVPVVDLDAAEAVLRRAGGRVSAARRALLEALFGADGPVSAEYLAAGRGGDHQPLDLASTYRNLEQLEAAGLVRHVHLGHGPGLYELVTEGEREYLVCERCGAVRAVAPDRLDRARREIERALGYHARFTHFPIVGLCAACAAEADRRPSPEPRSAGAPETTGGTMHGEDHPHEHPHAHEHAHGDEVHSHPHTEHAHDHVEHEHEHSHGDRVHSHPHVHEEGLEQAHAHEHDEPAGSSAG